MNGGSQKQMSQSVDWPIDLMSPIRMIAIVRASLFILALGLCTERTDASEDHKSIAPSAVAQNERLEQWGLFELSLPGPTDGNPFIDVQFRATFQQGDDKHVVDGFYDGEGI